MLPAFRNLCAPFVYGGASTVRLPLTMRTASLPGNTAAVGWANTLADAKLKAKAVAAMVTGRFMRLS